MCATVYNSTYKIRDGVKDKVTLVSGKMELTRVMKAVVEAGSLYAYSVQSRAWGKDH